MDLSELIARQRAAVENPPSESLNVILGGELVEVTVTKLRPEEWQKLVAARPPRTTSKTDRNIGYDQFAVPRDYPAERITVAGSEVTAEQWRDLFTLVDSMHQNNIHTVMWGLNVYAAIQELQKLGEARAGQQSS